MGFLLQACIFSLHDINWWTEVVWITVMFYQLFGLSFWRHPFTAEDPLVSKWCNAKFLQICSDEETNSSTSWMAWKWVEFSKYSFLGELLNIPLITMDLMDFSIKECKLKLLKHSILTLWCWGSISPLVFWQSQVFFRI